MTSAGSRSCYYRILNVSYDASMIDIKSSFRKLAKTLHPDTNGGCSIKTREFQIVSEAYDTLSNPSMRKQYDSENGIFSKSRRNNYGKANSSAAYDFQDQNIKMDKNGNPWGKMYAPRPPPGTQVFNHDLWFDMHYNGGELREALSRGRARRKMETSSKDNINGMPNSFVIAQRTKTTDNSEHINHLNAKEAVIHRMNLRRQQRRRPPKVSEDDACIIS